MVGLSTLGSLLGLLAVRGRTRQAALPVLVLPLVSPVIIAATRATARPTQGGTAGIAGWLGLLAAFDAAFLAAGYIVFGHLLEDRRAHPGGPEAIDIVLGRTILL